MRYLLLLIPVLVICSCKTKTESPVKTINVLAPTGTDLKFISEIATDVQYIPLQTAAGSLMKYIQEIKFSGNKFYLNAINEVLCFEKTGRFLYKLSKQGRGPEEYSYISDFDVSPQKNQILILTSGKLIFYSETDTGFIFSESLTLKPQPACADYIPGQNKILLSYNSASGNQTFECILFEPGRDTILRHSNFYKFTKNTKVTMAFRYDNIIFSNENLLRFKGFLSDTIFMISKNNEIIPYMILNTEGKHMTTDFLANIPMSEITGTGSAIKFLQIMTVGEVDRYLLYRYSYQQTTNWGVYDKISDENHKIDGKELLKDDISGGVNIEPKFTCKGLIISWTDALTFKTRMTSDDFRKVEVKNPQRKNELERLAQTVKEEDNQLLIVITPEK